MTSRGTLLLLIALVSGFAAAYGGGATSGSYNISATFSNYDAGNNPFTLQGDGSSSAIYDPNHDSSILSYLYPDPNCKGCGTTGYEWALDLSQSSRSFLVALAPVNGSSNGPFLGPTALNGKLRSRCFDPSNNVYSWLAIQTSDSNCAMRVDFTYNNVNYTLVMSPIEPGTGTATVTCTSLNSSTSTCSAWTDIPTTGVPNADVAHLYSVSKSGKLTLLGSYALSFEMTLTHP